MTGDAGAWSRLSVVTVTHDSADVVERCLRSVAAAHEVIVVDNASRDATRERVHGSLPGAVLIENRTNIGFGNACNTGFARANTEFVLFLNPDAALQDGAAEALTAAADRYPEAALLAPRIVAPGGAPLVTHDAALFARDDMPKASTAAPEGDICTWFLSGAALLVRKSFLGTEPPFDPKLFLYFEDDDLCLRLRKQGHALVQVHDAVVEHDAGNATPPRAAITWRKFWHMAWSRLYIEAKYRGRGRAQRTALKHLIRFAAKCIGNVLALKPAKAWRDAARFAGTLSWIVGLRAVR
ncbi:MAG: glycosyltransferase family 2 protein [Proteobacteria bacterium]|nr:glycosyltransferase family 2 protein [Pseudomonadota bacterium]